MKRLTEKTFLWFLTFIFLSLTANAQPAIEWAKCYGHTGDDIVADIQKAFGGGYVVLGTTDSSQYGAADFWLVKTDDTGAVIWTKYYGGSATDTAAAIMRVGGGASADSGYIMVGSTTSNDGNVTGNHGTFDFWVVKIDVNGNVVWQKTLGGLFREKAAAVTQTRDGGIVVTGGTDSYDGDVNGQHGGPDFWVVKLSGSGTLLWEKAFGGTGDESAYAIAATYDGGVIVAGEASSNDGDVSTITGMNDFWVVKLDTSGNLQWEKTYGSFQEDWATSVYQTTDSGYIVTGAVANYPIFGAPTATIKIDKHGALDTAIGWVTTATLVMKPAQDGGYVGLNWLPLFDCNVQKMDSNFNLAWSKTMGGTSTDYAVKILETDDGGYVIAANSQSNDGDVSDNHGGNDYWIVKLKATPNSIVTPSLNGSTVSFYPNPVKNTMYLSEKTNVRLINSLGQVVVNAQGVSSLNMENYPRGVYFMLFYDKKGTIISKEKVVKE